MKTLIKHATAVLMDEAGTVLPNAYVVVEGQQIVSVGADCPPGPFQEEIDGTGQVLPNRFRLARTGNRQILPHDRDFKRVQGTARHTAAAHGTALGPIVDDPP